VGEVGDAVRRTGGGTVVAPQLVPLAAVRADEQVFPPVVVPVGVRDAVDGAAAVAVAWLGDAEEARRLRHLAKRPVAAAEVKPAREALEALAVLHVPVADEEVEHAVAVDV